MQIGARSLRGPLQIAVCRASGNAHKLAANLNPSRPSRLPTNMRPSDDALGTTDHAGSGRFGAALRLVTRSPRPSKLVFPC